MNITEQPITINKGEEKTKFSFLYSGQAERLLEVDPQIMNVENEWKLLKRNISVNKSHI